MIGDGEQMGRPLYKYVFVLAALSCSRDKEAQSDTARAEASAASRGGASRGTSAARSAAVTAPRTILFVGTSLTAGYGLDPDSAYPLQIQRMIDSAGLRYSVINAGVSGETSSALLRRLDWLLRQPFEVIVIETGANDGLRGIPIETMRANIEQIVQRVRIRRPGARVVLVQMEAPPNLGLRYTRQFRSVFPEVAQKSDAVLLPFLLQEVAGNPDLNQADGIHPNYAGERIVARNVWKDLRPMLK